MVELLRCGYAAMTGWIDSKICGKISFDSLGVKIWGIIWLVGVYCKSNSLR